MVCDGWFLVICPNLLFFSLILLCFLLFFFLASRTLNGWTYCTRVTRPCVFFCVAKQEKQTLCPQNCRLLYNNCVYDFCWPDICRYSLVSPIARHITRNCLFRFSFFSLYIYCNFCFLPSFNYSKFWSSFQSISTTSVYICARVHVCFFCLCFVFYCNGSFKKLAAKILYCDCAYKLVRVCFVRLFKEKKTKPDLKKKLEFHLKWISLCI